MKLRKEERIAEYKKRTDELLNKMYLVLMRARRKVDDEAYRKTLEKLKKNI